MFFTKLSGKAGSHLRAISRDNPDQMNLHSAKLFIAEFERIIWTRGNIEIKEILERLLPAGHDESSGSSIYSGEYLSDLGEIAETPTFNATLITIPRCILVDL